MRPIQSTLISTGPLVKHKQRGPRAKRAAQRRGYSIPLGGRTAPAAEDKSISPAEAQWRRGWFACPFILFRTRTRPRPRPRSRCLPGGAVSVCAANRATPWRATEDDGISPEGAQRRGGLVCLSLYPFSYTYTYTSSFSYSSPNLDIGYWFWILDILLKTQKSTIPISIAIAIATMTPSPPVPPSSPNLDIDVGYWIFS